MTPDAEPPPAPPAGDDPPRAPSPNAPLPVAPSPDAPPSGPRLGDYEEPRVPRGCHPLVFGVVMATIQLGCTIYFMRTC